MSVRPCKFEVQGFCSRGRNCKYSHKYWEWPLKTLMLRQNYMLNRIYRFLDTNTDAMTDVSGFDAPQRTAEYALGTIGVLKSYLEKTNNITKSIACGSLITVLQNLDVGLVIQARDSNAEDVNYLRSCNTILSYIDKIHKKRQVIHILKKLPVGVLCSLIQSVISIEEKINSSMKTE
uniref:Protein M2-1 n=2 Tax=murine pneumonia virus TaxID=11263 RepID=F1DFI1_9MONO|nr:matrix protein M2-1 [Pneumovirus dog/Ane4/USA/2008]ADZ31995.1 matrix protein M2-1 [Pneumovirus dog/Brne17/USA/2008]